MVPTPPGDLARAGRSWWRKLHRLAADHDAELDAHETLLVAELCRLQDRCAVIRETMATLDPSAVSWSRLDTRLTQNALATQRLVSALGLPTGLVDDTPQPGRTGPSRRGQKAARARWAG